MATPANVFGTAVTAGARMQRVRTALSDKNLDGKMDDASEYLKKQKENWGSGVVTLCMFYNATGETLEYVDRYSLFGSFNEACPTSVQNGQWGAYLHCQKTGDAPRSAGFVIYRGKHTETEYCKQVFGWETRGDAYNNLVCCEILKDNSPVVPEDFYKHMEDKKTSHYVARNFKMSTTTTIEDGSTIPFYNATLTTDESTAATDSA